MSEFLKLDNDLMDKAIDLAQKDKVNVLYLADKLVNECAACLKHESDLLKLAVALEAMKHTKAEYDRLGLDESIFRDTMDDIRIWCENNNNKGLKNIGWISNHLKCELFKLGRLQYQLYTCRNNTLDYDLLPFDYGDNLIYIHIPQGEKLCYVDCVNSLKQAVQFFDKHFPDFEYRFFFCESWLLYENNWMFMEPSSNILQFQSLFDIVFSCDDDSQAIERIFGKRELLKSRYKEKTSLQRSAKAYMREGGKLGTGIGIIDKDEIL